MRRKVIQIAESTQLISLPRKWALKYGIKKGDELEITEQGNKLVVQSQKGIEGGNIDVEVKNLDRDSIMFLIRSLYKNGYDEIIVRFNETVCENIRTKGKENVMDVISQEVSRLNGVEIFTQKENYCIIRSISEDTAKAFDSMLRRVFLLSSETISDLIEGYEKGDFHLLATIQKKHDTITKFVAYCQRLLNKVGYSDFKKTDVVFHILEVLDTIIDLAKYSARNIINEKIKASKEGVAIGKAIKQSFDTYYELYYNFNLEKVYALNKNRYAIIKSISETQNKIQRNEFGILTNMEQILEHILNLTNSRIALQY